MNEMSETTRLIKKAAKNTYKKFTNVQKQSPKKTRTNVKMTKKTDKTVTFIDNKSKETKENKKFPQKKMMQKQYEKSDY